MAAQILGITPSSCWATRLIAALDLIDAGLMGSISRASPARQQAILAVLAHIGADAVASLDRRERITVTDEVLALRPICRDLCRAPALAILKNHFGDVAGDLHSALAKTNGVQPVAYYVDLVQMVLAPEIAFVIRELDALDAERLAIIQTLGREPSLLTSRWVMIMRSVAEAEKFVAAVCLVRERAYTRFDERGFSISAQESHASAADLLAPWMTCGDREIAPPLDLGPAFPALLAPDARRRAAATYRLDIDLIESVVGLLSGTRRYWTYSSRRVLIEAAIVGGRAPTALLLDIHGEHGRPIPLRLRACVERFAAEVGMPPMRAPEPVLAWAPLRRLLADHPDGADTTEMIVGVESRALVQSGYAR